MKRGAPAQFQELLLGSTHWIDVRAPIEFSDGAVPGAVNLPLLTDQERHEIGLTYKRHGQAAAIDLGHQLVGGQIRQARLDSWIREAHTKPNSVIYCFRGGQRSQIVQAWMKEAGCPIPIIEGGYKALRRFFLTSIAEIAPRLQWEVVDGPTGSGKTAFIKSSGRPYLDLEGLARHRGSAFGAMEEPQPAPADFENRLALELLKLSSCREPVLIENESRLIGKCSIPVPLFEKMNSSPRLTLNPPLEERVENIFADYIVSSKLGQRGDETRFDDFVRAVQAISRKLGGARTQEILQDLDASRLEFRSGRGLASNRIWIRKLMEWYYDPRYGR